MIRIVSFNSYYITLHFCTIIIIQLVEKPDDDVVRTQDRNRSQSNSSLTSNGRGHEGKSATHTEAEKELLLAKMQIVALKGQLESAVGAREDSVTQQPLTFTGTSHSTIPNSEGREMDSIRGEDYRRSDVSLSDSGSRSTTISRRASIDGSRFINNRNDSVGSSSNSTGKNMSLFKSKARMKSSDDDSNDDTENTYKHDEMEDDEIDSMQGGSRRDVGRRGSVISTSADADNRRISEEGPIYDSKQKKDNSNKRNNDIDSSIKISNSSSSIITGKNMSPIKNNVRRYNNDADDDSDDDTENNYKDDGKDDDQIDSMQDSRRRVGVGRRGSEISTSTDADKRRTTVEGSRYDKSDKFNNSNNMKGNCDDDVDDDIRKDRVDSRYKERHGHNESDRLIGSGSSLNSDLRFNRRRTSIVGSRYNRDHNCNVENSEDEDSVEGGTSCGPGSIALAGEKYEAGDRSRAENDDGRLGTAGRSAEIGGSSARAGIAKTGNFFVSSEASRHLVEAPQVGERSERAVRRGSIRGDEQSPISGSNSEESGRPGSALLNNRHGAGRSSIIGSVSDDDVADREENNGSAPRKSIIGATPRRYQLSDLNEKDEESEDGSYSDRESRRGTVVDSWWGEIDEPSLTSTHLGSTNEVNGAGNRVMKDDRNQKGFLDRPPKSVEKYSGSSINEAGETRTDGKRGVSRESKGLDDDRRHNTDEIDDDCMNQINSKHASRRGSENITSIDADKRRPSEGGSRYGNSQNKSKNNSQSKNNNRTNITNVRGSNSSSNGDDDGDNYGEIDSMQGSSRVGVGRRGSLVSTGRTTTFSTDADKRYTSVDESQYDNNRTKNDNRNDSVRSGNSSITGSNMSPIKSKIINNTKNSNKGDDDSDNSVKYDETDSMQGGSRRGVVRRGSENSTSTDAGKRRISEDRSRYDESNIQNKNNSQRKNNNSTNTNNVRGSNISSDDDDDEIDDDCMNQISSKQASRRGSENITSIDADKRRTSEGGSRYDKSNNNANKDNSNSSTIFGVNVSTIKSMMKKRNNNADDDNDDYVDNVHNGDTQDDDVSRTQASSKVGEGRKENQISPTTHADNRRTTVEGSRYDNSQNKNKNNSDKRNNDVDSSVRGSSSNITRKNMDSSDDSDDDAENNYRHDDKDDDEIDSMQGGSRRDVGRRGSEISTSTDADKRRTTVEGSRYDSKQKKDISYKRNNDIDSNSTGKNMSPFKSKMRRNNNDDDDGSDDDEIDSMQGGRRRGMERRGREISTSADADTRRSSSYGSVYDNNRSKNKDNSNRKNNNIDKSNQGSKSSSGNDKSAIAIKSKMGRNRNDFDDHNDDGKDDDEIDSMQASRRGVGRRGSVISTSADADNRRISEEGSIYDSKQNKDNSNKSNNSIRSGSGNEKSMSAMKSKINETVKNDRDDYYNNHDKNDDDCTLQNSRMSGSRREVGIKRIEITGNNSNDNNDDRDHVDHYSSDDSAENIYNDDEDMNELSRIHGNDRKESQNKNTNVMAGRGSLHDKRRALIDTSQHPSISELLQVEKRKVKDLQALLDAQACSFEANSKCGGSSKSGIREDNFRRASLLSNESRSLSDLQSLRSSYEAKLHAQEVEIRRQEAYVTVQDEKCREIEGLLQNKEKKMKESDGVAKRLASSERRQEETIYLQGLKEAGLLKDLKQKEQSLTALQASLRKQQDDFSVEREELGDQLAHMAEEISAMRLEMSQSVSEREKSEAAQTCLQREKEELIETYEEKIEVVNNNYSQHHAQVSSRKMDFS